MSGDEAVAVGRDERESLREGVRSETGERSGRGVQRGPGYGDLRHWKARSTEWWSKLW